jgi:hypothetical protein
MIDYLSKPFMENPYRGYADESGREVYPTKAGLFETSYGNALAMEQLFQNFDVFRNMTRGDPSHMDSYGTVVHFESLETCLADLKERYVATKEDWLPLVRTWLNNRNQQPPIRICAIIIADKWGITKEEQGLK